nr:hypothetical protein [uncultured Psychroserpens sp.]
MSRTTQTAKLTTFITSYYWIAVIPLFIYGLIAALKNKQDIDQNQTITFGVIYNSTAIVKQYSKRRYKYEFSHNNKVYYGTAAAYITDGIRIGNFYKVEFSHEDPHHNRLLFDVEYSQKLIIDNSGKVTDTLYIEKTQELHHKMNTIIDKYELKTNQ